MAQPDLSSAESRDNNFDTLRFFAAFGVLITHACALSAGHNDFQPLMAFSGGQATLGSISVAVFFFISGYLIPQSFERSNSIRRFIKARVLRLMPALIVLLLLLGFVLGPLVTDLPLRQYFTSGQLYEFLVLNGLLLDFANSLPGVFAANPFQGVDGSLWTLAFEAECYAMVLVLGVMGLLDRRVSSAIFIAGLIYLALHDKNDMTDFPQQNHRVLLFTHFLAGMLVYQWRMRLNGPAAAVCGAMLFVTLITGGFWIALNLFGAYLTIYLAKGLPFRLPNMARSGDLSYGIYIYHWPVQQLVIMHTPHDDWLQTLLLSVPIVLAFAYISWHLVEKPALALKDRPILFHGSLRRVFRRIG